MKQVFWSLGSIVCLLSSPCLAFKVRIDLTDGTMIIVTINGKRIHVPIDHVIDVRHNRVGIKNDEFCVYTAGGHIDGHDIPAMVVTERGKTFVSPGTFKNLDTPGYLMFKNYVGTFENTIFCDGPCVVLKKRDLLGLRK